MIAGGVQGSIAIIALLYHLSPKRYGQISQSIYPFHQSRLMSHGDKDEWKRTYRKN